MDGILITVILLFVCAEWFKSLTAQHEGTERSFYRALHRFTLFSIVVVVVVPYWATVKGDSFEDAFMTSIILVGMWVSLASVALRAICSVYKEIVEGEEQSS